MGEPFFPQGSEREALNWAKQHEKKEYHGTLPTCPVKSELLLGPGAVPTNEVQPDVSPKPVTE